MRDGQRMRFLKNLFPREQFLDGAAIWPSGREQYTYADPSGRQFEIQVLYDGQSTGMNIVVQSSIRAVDGSHLDAMTSSEIVGRARAYFELRGQSVALI